MEKVILSQLQFAITCVYHFFFVPLTLGLSILTAIIETMYWRTGKEVYKRMAKFWGKLFIINFAMGVVTGIVMEFQFGMNWSEYSRFVGDIFGAPLAIEALMAFFLESTFIGIWLFGWDRVPKGIHTLAIWLTAIGSNISALWILIANSFMHNPVGYTIEGGRAMLTDFGALITNPYVWTQFPHTVLGGLATGSFFMLGISAYHLVKKTDSEFFTNSFKIAVIGGIFAAVSLLGSGHLQAQRLMTTHPMKMAAAEALWETEDPAALSLFTIFDENSHKNIVDIRIPGMLSFLGYNRFSGEVRGINDIQTEYEQRYGPGDYSPSVFVAYWSFRAMVGAGVLLILIPLFALFQLYIRKVKDLSTVKLLRWFPYAIALPYIANTAGWLLTEMGRQPWIVFGLMKTADATSPAVSTGEVFFSLIGFTLIYGALMVVDVFLLVKYAKNITVDDQSQPSLVEA